MRKLEWKGLCVRIERDENSNSDQLIRIFGVSDLHVDHEENWEVISKWKNLNFNKETDVLIVAGDISTKLELVKETLVALKEIFPHLFYVPGNNEFRLRSKAESFNHSVEKFEYIMNLCKELRVYTSPQKINGVWIVPLFSWYSPYFDKSFDGKTSYQKQWLDFYKIRWPEKLNSDISAPDNYFLSLNEQNLQEYDGPVITFSHFLPRFELLPKLFNKKSLRWVAGSSGLDDQLRKIGSKVHLCGHTHVDFDVVLQNVRYIQHSFGHPAEQKTMWKRRWFSSYQPKEIYSSSSASNCSIQ